MAKLNAAGSALVYATYLGGSGQDGAGAIAVDADGAAYVTGVTNSADFPVVNAVQPAFGGSSDAFVAKLDPMGTALLYATYLGGSNVDNSDGIAVDAAGHAYVTGWTASPDFPTKHALQPSFAGGGSIGADAFVAKLTAEGTALVYATYLGGSDDDFGGDIAADEGGFAYLTGLTKSRDFPTKQPWQPEHGGGLRDVFVAEVTPTGSALVYATWRVVGTSLDTRLKVEIDNSA